MSAQLLDLKRLTELGMPLASFSEIQPFQYAFMRVALLLLGNILRIQHSQVWQVFAVAAATGSTATGIFISYHIDGSTGACIVLVQTLLFVASLAFAPKHGILRRIKAA